MESGATLGYGAHVGFGANVELGVSMQSSGLIRQIRMKGAGRRVQE